MRRGALPSLKAPSLTSLYIKASGLGPPVGGGGSGENLPSFLKFDRSAMCTHSLLFAYTTRPCDALQLQDMR